MDWDPLHDPFVEGGYYGYSVRAIAHRRSAASFIPLLEIRNYAHRAGERLYERVFDEEFPDADEAIRHAMGKGYQLIDNLIDRAELDEAVEHLH